MEPGEIGCQIGAHVTAVEEVTARLEAVEASNNELRARIGDVLDEAESWRRTSLKPWAQQLRDILAEAKAPHVAATGTHAGPSWRQCSSAAGAHAPLRARGAVAAEEEARQRAELTNSEKSAEAALQAEIRQLREENQRLTQIALSTAAAGPVATSAKSGRLDAVRRRAADCCRKVRVMERENAALRREIDNQEEYRRRLELTLLAQTQRMAKARRARRAGDPCEPALLPDARKGSVGGGLPSTRDQGDCDARGRERPELSEGAPMEPLLARGAELGPARTGDVHEMDTLEPFDMAAFDNLAAEIEATLSRQQFAAPN
eukprot:CAMPEP_0179076236 /NCGR_PEP_ID=MMETSP0796-20121207/34000_1 /TAXON_ID=73915 /ORGANISM="Pyrodinium bahamense, Strain pbaha01" /LENGTH=317 /DNA_ID=CAMNT_0020773489 /DNA_START=12 /DNA_END=965 /DNA_ORIENTATION=+